MAVEDSCRSEFDQWQYRLCINALDDSLYCSEGFSIGGDSGGGSSGILVKLQWTTSTIAVEELQSFSGRLAKHFQAYDI